MVYNKLTLAFPGKDESLFLQRYFADSIIQVRLGLIFAASLYAAFGYLDSLIVPEYAKLFHIIRFYIVIPCAFGVFVLSFTEYFQKVWQYLLSIAVVIGGTGINIMTMLAPQNYSYYAGIMLVFSAGYFLLRLRFFYATIAGWTILVIFDLVGIFYAHSSSVILISYNFFFISCNTLIIK